MECRLNMSYLTGCHALLHAYVYVKPLSGVVQVGVNELRPRQAVV